MSSLRARYPITHIPFLGGVEDDYGNVVETWDTPRRVFVYGKSSPKTEEDLVAGPNRLSVDVILLIPKTFQAKEKDRFTFEPPETADPQVYEVTGLPETSEGNPFGWNPGGRLKLSRVTG